LTLIGPDRLVVHGRAGDTPHGVTSAAAFIAGLSRLHARQQRSHAGQERSADTVSRLGPMGVLEVMGAETVHD
jgi:hypothetical protein